MFNDPIISQSDIIVSRSNSLLGKESRTSDNFIAEADAETEAKRKAKIEEINNEVERRRTAFEIV